MNLSTARALLRAHEIALRKTHGAHRRSAYRPVLGEAVLTSIISLVLALALVEILQPAFGCLLQHTVTLHYVGDLAPAAAHCGDSRRCRPDQRQPIRPWCFRVLPPYAVLPRQQCRPSRFRGALRTTLVVL